ncbi:MAG TPA: hypothetical protein VFW33_20065 [Gemmataceae bacterium]|nr:hypothetical protein [Gemmataceae bacterium]
MMRIFAAAVLLLVPALLVAGEAFAGPPQGVSGKMVRDEVVEWCRRYLKEWRDEKRTACLRKLRPTRDPRVAVELWKTWEEGSRGVKDGVDFSQAALLARSLLSRWYVPANEPVDRWWKASEADLRRRASQLPR